MADASQRTEQPTPRRIEKARQEGQFISSRELVGAVQFLAFVWILSRFSGAWLAEARHLTRMVLERAFRTDLGPDGLVSLVRGLFAESMLPLAAVAALLVLLSLGVQLASTRMGFSLKRVAPDLKRLNPVARLKELARNNLWALAKALVMLPLFSYAVWVIARENLTTYSLLPLEGLERGVRVLGESLLALLWKSAGLFLVLGLVDLARARRRYFKDLRMTRQEVREEIKDVEGNPLVKARIRRLQRDLARRRMMKEVKTATAVIVNPTHYAVAIRYQPEQMAAPVVVAKGKNYLARRIREIAIENLVPIVENPPLAQALYKSVQVGQAIPVHLYRAVAEILAYIYRLTHRRLSS